MSKKDNQELIPNEQATTMTESGANTPIEVASAKALHDEKVMEDVKLPSSNETIKEDFDRFNIDAIDELDVKKK